jgi:hypothetical protein
MTQEGKLKLRYSFITSLRAAVTDTSTSQSARFDRSLKLSGFSFGTLKTLHLPIPNNNEVDDDDVDLLQLDVQE